MKEALAQPEQERPQNCGTGYCSCIECVMEPEPVATVAEIHMSRYTIEWTNGPLPEGTKLYTTPPQRKPLTDEEYSALAEQYTGADGLDCVDFGRAVARHYGIKE